MKEVWLAKSPLIQTVFVAFGLLILLQILERVLWVLVLVLLAFILAAALIPIVNLIRSVSLPPSGWRIPKVVAVLILYLMGAIVLAGITFIVGASLVTELIRLFESLPGVAADLAERLNEFAQRAGIAELVPSPEDIISQIQNLSAGAISTLRAGGALVQGFGNFVFNLAIVLVLALFLVVESEQISNFWIGLFPPAQRYKVRQLTTSVGNKIGYWLLGQLAVATITGTLAAIGSALLGLPYAVLIGVVTAILDLAPMVGPGLMAIPIFFLGLSQSLIIAIVAAGYFLILALIDGNVLSPIITGRAVQLSPALVIIVVPIGFALYGPVGALIAVPIAGALQLVTNEIFLPWLRRKQGMTSNQRPTSDGEPQEQEAQ